MLNIRDYIDGQFRNEKKEQVGIGGFTALARITEKTVRSSEVPTVYLEDGSPISEHIIRKPLSIIIEGNVSDVYKQPSNLVYAIQRVQKAIGVITQYLPERTEAQVSVVSSLANDVVDALNGIDAEIKAGQQLTGYLGLINNSIGGNIKSFVDAMEAHFFSNETIAIDMPYNKYDRMRIINIEIEKDNSNIAVSFRLEAKQINFVEDILVPSIIVNAPSENVDGQLENITDKGVQEGEEIPTSLLNYLTDQLGL